MRLLGPSRLSLESRLAVDAALDEAFAPLRGRATNISPARVRAAVRWTRPEPTGLRGVALLSRITELSVAAVVGAFLVGGSLGGVPQSATSDAVRDTIDRGQATRTTLRPSDTRMTAGDVADTAASVRREAGRATAEDHLADNAVTVRRDATHTNRAPEPTDNQ
jgi:hypothetical protein